jgi:hypothetical protein
MTTMQLCTDELAALRELEKAVRACGLPTMMVSGQPQLDLLADALKAVAAARSVAHGDQLPVFHQTPSKPVM